MDLLNANLDYNKNKVNEAEKKLLSLQIRRDLMEFVESRLNESQFLNDQKLDDIQNNLSNFVEQKVEYLLEMDTAKLNSAINNLKKEINTHLKNICDNIDKSLNRHMYTTQSNMSANMQSTEKSFNDLKTHTEKAYSDLKTHSDKAYHDLKTTNDRAYSAILNQNDKLYNHYRQESDKSYSSLKQHNEKTYTDITNQINDLNKKLDNINSQQNNLNTQNNLNHPQYSAYLHQNFRPDNNSLARLDINGNIIDPHHEIAIANLKHQHERAINDIKHQLEDISIAATRTNDRDMNDLKRQISDINHKLNNINTNNNNNNFPAMQSPIFGMPVLSQSSQMYGNTIPVMGSNIPMANMTAFGQNASAYTDFYQNERLKSEMEQKISQLKNDMQFFQIQQYNNLNEKILDMKIDSKTRGSASTSDAAFVGLQSELKDLQNQMSSSQTLSLQNQLYNNQNAQLYTQLLNSKVDGVNNNQSVLTQSQLNNLNNQVLQSGHALLNGNVNNSDIIAQIRELQNQIGQNHTHNLSSQVTNSKLDSINENALFRLDNTTEQKSQINTELVAQIESLKNQIQQNQQHTQNHIRELQNQIIQSKMDDVSNNATIDSTKAQVAQLQAEINNYKVGGQNNYSRTSSRGMYYPYDSAIDEYINNSTKNKLVTPPSIITPNTNIPQDYTNPNSIQNYTSTPNYSSTPTSATNYTMPPVLQQVTVPLPESTTNNNVVVFQQGEDKDLENIKPVAATSETIISTPHIKLPNQNIDIPSLQAKPIAQPTQVPVTNTAPVQTPVQQPIVQTPTQHQPAIVHQPAPSTVVSQPIVQPVMQAQPVQPIIQPQVAQAQPVAQSPYAIQTPQPQGINTSMMSPMMNNLGANMMNQAGSLDMIQPNMIAPSRHSYQDQNMPSNPYAQMSTQMAYGQNPQMGYNQNPQMGFNTQMGQSPQMGFGPTLNMYSPNMQYPAQGAAQATTEATPREMTRSLERSKAYSAPPMRSRRIMPTPREKEPVLLTAGSKSSATENNSTNRVENNTTTTTIIEKTTTPAASAAPVAEAPAPVSEPVKSSSTSALDEMLAKMAQKLSNLGDQLNG